MSLLCRLWLLMLVVGVVGTIFFGWLAMGAHAEEPNSEWVKRCGDA